MPAFDVVSAWPELFVDLDEEQQDTVRQVFATESLTGSEPERAAVVDLVAFTRGEIDFDVYLRRSADRAANTQAGIRPER